MIESFIRDTAAAGIVAAAVGTVAAAAAESRDPSGCSKVERCVRAAASAIDPTQRTPDSFPSFRH